MLFTLVQWLPFTILTILIVGRYLTQTIKLQQITQKITLACFTIYLIAIVGLCWTPTSYNFDQAEIIHYSIWGPVKYILIPLQHIDLEWWLNIIMTVPLGFLLPMIRPNFNWSQIIISGLMTGLTLETTQFILDWLINLHRWVETDDVLTNFLGVLLGYSIFLILRHSPMYSWIQKFELPTEKSHS